MIPLSRKRKPKAAFSDCFLKYEINLLYLGFNIKSTRASKSS
ncbi:hypothetical protein JCM19314_696 [Nonlabens ulvanivorans]|uniref:Uncharacterized protein n=1 Tax=Nonlabens ulvanivorans TaxID=906888 RepID=A0A090R0M4_NONUL|nr:hypothetical protein JCM19314_696 [Nonlabens ulvanivorans]